jgi:hypothetical protein
MSSISPIGIPNSLGYLKNDGIGTLTWNNILPGPATKTVAAMSIYVDKAATGTGDGTSWTNAFTTIQAAITSLPTVLEHAVTIYIRKGTTAYSETLTIQQITGKGSLTIRGEYYWNGQCATATAGASTTKFNITASDGLNVAVGDLVLITHAWGGSGAYTYFNYTTVKAVTSIGSNVYQVELDTASDWGNINSTDYYTIVKTYIAGPIDVINSTVAFLGIYINSTSLLGGFVVSNYSWVSLACIFIVCNNSTPLSITTSTCRIQSSYLSETTTAKSCIYCSSLASINSAINNASGSGTIVCNSVSTNPNYPAIALMQGSSARLYDMIIKCGASGIAINTGSLSNFYGFWFTILSGTGTGLIATGNSYIEATAAYVNNLATTPKSPTTSTDNPVIV